MKNKRMILLKALLLSTSRVNTLKYSTDKKKKSGIIGAYFGVAILYLMLLGYCLAMAYGFGQYGLIFAIPEMTAVIISVMSFFLTVLKTNGYLFGFKEYDMLMAMPFSAREVLEEKFLYMYIKSFPMMGIISVSMMIGYIIFADFSLTGIVMWVILTLFLPLIPMVLASLVGALITGIGTKFKYKRMVSLILTFIFVIACFCSRFIIEKIIREDQIDAVIDKTAGINSNFNRYYLPGKWFSDACNNGSIGSCLLFLGVSIIVLELFVFFVGKSYKTVNSILKTSEVHKKTKTKEIKKKNVVNSIAYKELRRFLGSNLYITNCGMGQVLVIIFSVVVLFVNPQSVIDAIAQGAPVTPQMLLPAIPFVVYFMVGMVPTTCCSLSLEGKNLWIPLSMPIDSMTLIKGKMLFSEYISIPFALLGTICMSVSFEAGIINTLLFAIVSVLLCTFSTTYGMACGIKFRKYEYENEIEVIKQGSSVVAYLFPNLFVTMILIVLSVIAGFRFPIWTIVVFDCTLSLALTFVCYLRVKKLVSIGIY